MEKLINPYDKEYMKMAMLKHEEIFREQVYELHRLYQTQKLLMKNMSNMKQVGQNHQHQQFHHQYQDMRRDTTKNTVTTLVKDHHLDSNKKIRQHFDLEIRPNADQEYIAESIGEDHIDEDETDQLELTLGLSSYNNVGRRRKTASASDTAPSFSSSNSAGSTSQVLKQPTLTFSSTNPTGHHKWGLENLPVSNPTNLILGRGRVQSNNTNVEEQFRSQDSLNNSPWLFQILSLNMT